MVSTPELRNRQTVHNVNVNCQLWSLLIICGFLHNVRFWTVGFGTLGIQINTTYSQSCLVGTYFCSQSLTFQHFFVWLLAFSSCESDGCFSETWCNDSLSTSGAHFTSSSAVVFAAEFIGKSKVQHPLGAEQLGQLTWTLLSRVSDDVSMVALLA